MTKAEMIAQLRRVANELEAAPEFVAPVTIRLSANHERPTVQLTWEDFSRLFTTSGYSMSAHGEHLDATAYGIDWTAARKRGNAAPAIARIPIAEAACEEGGRYV